MRLIIDNFGTGHGSIGALAHAPISGIKLPRHFVTSLSEGPGERLVPALIALAHGLDLKVTAVGVETADQLALLRFHGCDQAQGFLFSPPLTNDALVRLLQEGQQPDGMRSELVAS
jgi:EAL domain-containing protein (putative c-di-GMP-specific phosphodiesterase class I)